MTRRERSAYMIIVNTGIACMCAFFMWGAFAALFTLAVASFITNLVGQAMQYWQEKK